jgi:hypothetical protein
MAVELISQIWQLFCITGKKTRVSPVIPTAKRESTSIVVRVLALASSVVDAAA